MRRTWLFCSVDGQPMLDCDAPKGAYLSLVMVFALSIWCISTEVRFIFNWATAIPSTSNSTSNGFAVTTFQL